MKTIQEIEEQNKEYKARVNQISTLSPMYLWESINLNLYSESDSGINFPGSELLEVQQNLFHDLKQFTNYKFITYIENAQPHLGAIEVFKTDISSFFRSCYHDHIEDLLKYSDRINPKYKETFSHWFDLNKIFMYRLDSDRVSYLPVGCCTSSLLADMSMWLVDRDIRQYLDTLSLNLVFTRYVDDITISSKERISNTTKRDIQTNLARILDVGYNFSTNQRKTKWINWNHDQAVITGVDIRGISLKVTRAYIKQNILPLFNTLCNNLLNYNYSYLPILKWYSIKKPIKNFEELLPIYFNEILPKLNYIKQVNKDQYQQLLIKLERHLNNRGLSSRTDSCNFILSSIDRKNSYNLGLDQPSYLVNYFEISFVQSLVNLTNSLLNRETDLPF